MNCEDCDTALTEGNTDVDQQEAFWMNVTWEDETRCAECKSNLDGAPIYSTVGGAGSDGMYEQNMRSAGRGHLL